MIKKPHNPVIELRNRILDANAQQIKVLSADPYFGRAMEQLSPEDYPEFSQDVLEILLPHIQLDSNTLGEMSCWISSPDLNKQLVAKVLIEKFVREQPDFENKMVWVQMALADKYSFVDSRDIASAMDRFKLACEQESNAQQAKRIGQCVEASTSCAHTKKAKI